MLGSSPTNDLSRFAVPVALFSTAFFAGTLLLAKVLGADGLSPFQVSAGRFVFGLIALGFYCALRPSEFPKFDHVPWRSHFFRSICGWLGASCMFGAAIFMPLGEATAISFLNPLVAMALAAFFLNEALNLSKYLAALFGVLGAILILRPGIEAIQPAALFAFGAAIFLGVEAIFIKQLSDREPLVRVLLINNFIGSVVASLTAFFFWNATPDLKQWSLLIVLGATMVFGQSLFVRAMKWGEASQISPVLYAVLVFTAVYDYLFFGEILSFWSALGSCSILLAAVLLSAGSRHG
ncbi:MAG: DMT family transporter [Pseudomonadota bacterium]